jgi:hypothetical protein
MDNALASAGLDTHQGAYLDALADDDPVAAAQVVDEIGSTLETLDRLLFDHLVATQAAVIEHATAVEASLGAAISLLG